MLEDPTFWALVGLIGFLAVLAYYKVPPLLGASLDKRAEGIRDELEQARRLREEAQALLAEYQRKAREAEGEAEEIIDQAKREAEALGAEAKKRMEDYVTSRTRMAEQKIAQAEAQAVAEVRAQAVDVAMAATTRVLTQAMDERRSAALIDEAIADLERKLH